MSESLRVSNISIRFDGVTALDDVSLEVRAGEVLAVVGPNGSGKTTLLNVISGYIKPHRGFVEICGNNVATRSVSKRAQLGLARGFQKTRIFEGLSVNDNFRVSRNWLQQSPIDRRKNGLLKWLSGHSEIHSVDGMLAANALSGTSSVPARNLSFGQKKLIEQLRLAFERAPIYLLDEPFAGLSVDNQQRVSAIIEQLRADGAAILLVEHNLGMVNKLADRVLVLDKGSVVAEGGTELINRPSSFYSKQVPSAAHEANRQQFDSPPKQLLLEIRDLSVVYGKTTALSHVDIDVYRGDVLCILGPNGSGKSSLLGALTGTLSEAQITGLTALDGKRLDRFSTLARLSRRMGYMPQKQIVFDQLTVEEHFRLNRGRQSNLEGIRHHVKSALLQYFPQLLEKWQNPAGSLSGGMKQALALTRLLVSDYDMLLLDEPFTGLSDSARRDLADYLQQVLNSTDKTVIVVEQDIAFALNVATRVVVLHHGKKVLDGFSRNLTKDTIDNYIFGIGEVHEPSKPNSGSGGVEN